MVVLLLHMNIIMYLDVTTHIFTTHIFGNNGTITTQLPLHYVLSVLLLPITTVIMRPLRLIIQLSDQ
jgi:hypothetical protein